MTARSLPLIALLIVTLGTACACPSLTTRALRSGAYRIDDEIVQLTEGEYRLQYTDDSATERVVTLTDVIARGDLETYKVDGATRITIKSIRAYVARQLEQQAA